MIVDNVLTVISDLSRVSSDVSSITTDPFCNPTLVEPASPPICKAISKDVENVFTKVRVLHGGFYQVISLISKINEGVVATGSDRSVSATGRIVPHRRADPTDVNTAYVHFHAYGPLVDGSPQSFLLLPMMRSSSAPGSAFLCPIKAGQSVVSVLSASEPTFTVVVKELNVNDPKSESARDCLWFAGSASGAYCRLYAMPDGVRKLYMTADGAGRVFLTEDEELPVPNEGEENPETDMRLYLKYHDNDDN